MDKTSLLFRSARSVYRFVRNDVIDLALVPYGRARQRNLLASSERSNSHTYTSFYRSPAQLGALTGPVIEHLRNRDEVSILVFAGSNGAEAYTIASELCHRRPSLRFHIRASDLHAETVGKAKSATYTRREITQALQVPDEFFERTFDRVGDDYVVKPHIREKVSFEQADLYDPELSTSFDPADIVFVQNVLFHMPPAMAREAFARVMQFLKPGSVLFFDGVELDMRVDLVKQAGLEPLDYAVKEIYTYSRSHVPRTWWRYYWGSEPYLPFAADRLTRYGTIFMVPETGIAAE